ncbi:MAG: TRAM domain-containing protein [Candidatus Woesearchaeota archaeon]
MQQRKSFNKGPSRGGGFGKPPVKVGDELDVTIEAVGEKGDGIAKKDGFVLFVPGVKEGAQVKVRITRVLRKVGFAEVIGEGTAAPGKKELAKEEEPEEPEAPEEEPEEPEAPEEEPEEPEAPEDSETFGEEE